MNKFFYFLFILSFGFAKGQFDSKVIAKVTSTTFDIGEQIDFYLNVEVDSVQKITFPDKLSINPIETLESFPIDTQNLGDKYLLVKRYNLIQFDSGYYFIPSQRVLINGFSKLSNPVKIRVNDIEVDTLKQKMYEIKPVQIVSKSYRLLFIKIGLLVLIITAIIFIIYLYKVYQKKLLKKKNIIPPFEKAINSLKELEKRQPKDQMEYKSYYSDLIDVLRLYFEEETDIDALESTSDQLLMKLEGLKKEGKLDLDDKTIKNLQTVLNTADLVKFARAIPDIGKNDIDIKLVEEAVVNTKEVLPEPTLEELRAKKQYEELIRKQKVNRTIKWILSLLGVSTFFSFVILFLIYGYYPVKDTIFRYPTKKLIDQDWVSSEYGVPPIKISSPKILKRINLKEKTITFFQMDSIEADFYSEILFETKYNSISSDKKNKSDSNISNAEETQKIIDKTIDRLKIIGAVNILFNSENFTTPKGLPTLKISGTLDYSKNKSKERVRSNFTSLVVNYDEGQILMTFFYEKNDRYGEKILNKMINSIELIKEL